MNGDINLLRDFAAGSGSTRDPCRQKRVPHLRHVAGKASRLRELMQDPLPVPGASQHRGRAIIRRACLIHHPTARRDICRHV